MSRRKRNSFGTSCEQWRTVQSTHAQHSYLSHIEQTKSIELIITSQGKSMSVRIFSCARNATPANNAFDTFRSSFSSAHTENGSISVICVVSIWKVDGKFVLGAHRIFCSGCSFRVSTFNCFDRFRNEPVSRFSSIQF